MFQTITVLGVVEALVFEAPASLANGKIILQRVGHVQAEIVGFVQRRSVGIEAIPDDVGGEARSK